MVSLFKKFKNKKVIIVVAIFLIVLVVVGYFWLDIVQAAGNVTPTTKTDSKSTSSFIANILTLAVMLLVSFVGSILTVFIDQLMGVANYNNFIDSSAVDVGWVVIRDLSNIFFIIIMLLISFGTLFKIETYEYKKVLPKLIIAVILVNFSKMIVGAAIDVGQVIMLTFVNAFNGVATGAIVNGLGVTTMLEIRDSISGVTDKIDDWNIFGAAILALIMLVVACVVILALIVVLLFRVLMLWILIIFAPFAFLASVLPTSPLQKVGFFGQYWNYLSKYIIVGPILAFFLWLSFSILSQLDNANSKHVIALARKNASGESAITGSRAAGTDQEYIAYLASKISSPQAMFDFMVTIALLIGSLVVTQQMGVMGGSFGMTALNKVKSTAGKLGKAGTFAIGRKLDKGSIRLQEKMGVEKLVSLRPSNIKKAWQASRERKEERFYKSRGVYGGMEDRFNSIMSRGKDKTDNKKIEEEQYVAQQQKEISSAGEDEAVVRKRMMDIGEVDQDGIYKINMDFEADFRAMLRILTANHDPNEIFMDPKTGKAYDQEYSPNNVVKFVLTAVDGDEEKAAKILHDMGHIGFENGDAQLKGLTRFNIETGKHELTKIEADEGEGTGDFDKYMKKKYDWRKKEAQKRAKDKNYVYKKGEKEVDDQFLKSEKIGDLQGRAREIMLETKQGKLGAAFQAKKTERQIATTITKQNLANQGKDYVMDKELSTHGKEILLESTGAISGHYGYIKPETKEWLESNVEAILDFARSDETNDAEKKELYKAVNAIIGGGKIEGDVELDDIRDRVEKGATKYEETKKKKGGGKESADRKSTDKADEEMGTKGSGDKTKDTSESGSNKGDKTENDAEEMWRLRNEAEVARHRADNSPGDSYHYRQAREEADKKKARANELEKQNKNSGSQVEAKAKEAQKLRNEAQVAQQRAGNSPVDSIHYKQAKEEADSKNKRAEKLEKEVIVQHEPDKAKSEINEIGQEAFKYPKQIAEAGKKLAEAIGKIEEDISKGAEIDISKIGKDLEKQFSELNKEVGKNIKSGYKAPQLDFVANEKVDKLKGDTEAQKKFLKQLRSVAINLVFASKTVKDRNKKQTS